MVPLRSATPVQLDDLFIQSRFSVRSLRITNQKMLAVRYSPNLLDSSPRDRVRSR